ncbi:hypothetical protein [Parashewanella tropica]|uniref:hypothetical protein n=1 Tax=Parashewanella tropica TaxID=2547970 RepID=UPI00105A2B9E|nr:hypothetical protein [Parashewanella tropica]
MRNFHVWISIVSTLLVVACGNDKNHDQQLVSIKGKVFDDYINGAKVCLDKTRNGKCDPNEPTAMSTEGGNFTLANVPKAHQEQYSLVAEVSVKAVDEMNGQTVPKPYTMTASAGSDVINPYTTLIDNQVTPAQLGRALKIEENQQESMMKMLQSDYIALQQSPEITPQLKSELNTFQKLARMTVTLMAENMERFKNSNTDSVSQKEIMGLVADKALMSMDNLVEEMNFVDQQNSNKFTSTMNFSDKTMLSGMISMDDVSDQVAVQKARKNSTAVNVAEMALHSLSGFNTFYSEVTAEGPKSEYMNLSLNPVSFNANVSRMQFQGSEFSPASERIGGFYSLTASGWKQVKGDYQLQDPKDKERFPMHKEGFPELDVEMQVRKVNIESLPIRLVLDKRSSMMLKESPIMDMWAASIAADKTFSSGSVSFDISTSSVNDAYLLADETDCANTDELCNQVLLFDNSGTYSPIQELTQTKTSTPSNGDLNKLTGAIIASNGNQFLVAELLDDGNAIYYQISPNESDPTLKKVTQIAEGKWQQKTINNRVMYVMPLPMKVMNFDYSKRKRSTLIMTEYQNQVRHGQYLAKGSMVREDLMAFNKNAKNDIMEAIDISKLKITGQPPLTSLPALCRVGDSMKLPSGLPDLSTIRSDNQYQHAVDSCKPFNKATPTLSNSQAESVSKASKYANDLMNSQISNTGGYRLSRFNMDNMLVEEIDLGTDLTANIKRWNKGNLTTQQGSYNFITQSKIRIELRDSSNNITEVKTMTFLNLANGVITVKVFTQQPEWAAINSEQGIVSTERFMLAIQ